MNKSGRQAPRRSGSKSRCLRGLVTVSALAVMAAAQADLSTKERIELLERRVSRITELTLQVNELQRENRELRGRIEEQGYALDRLQQKQKEMYLDLDQRLSKVSRPVTPVVPSITPPEAPELAQPDSSSSVKPGATAAPSTDDPQSAYQAAYELLRPENRKYEQAVTAFSDFLQTYPNSDLAPNAQYWLGEANYVLQNNEAALKAFQQVVERYPLSAKVPGALLKIGYLQHSKGDVAAAESVLSRVMNEFPGTPAAQMAQQRIERIRRESR
jgi:tol-pal system protein YbgF